MYTLAYLTPMATEKQQQEWLPGPLMQSKGVFSEDNTQKKAYRIKPAVNTILDDDEYT